MPARSVTKKSAKKPAGKAAVRKPTRKASPARVLAPSEDELSPAQRELLDAIRSGPRGGSTQIRGPFAVFLHAPAFGDLAQKLGGYCRYQTAVPARLSELAILVTARLWRAQYEWFAHEPQAERAGVKPETIRELHQGRIPKTARKDERAIYDLIHELYKSRRVSDKNFKRVRNVLGETGTIELVGILGYYVMISMILNVFRMPLPEGSALPFPE
ncbi:MAG: carboxymuconolactone decarboxylase family protein [Hyphomicrobiales bacterium]|nr:carboxymuconolactone decarboxylase family protein [Hyphomicrobiales bacterium]